jgi:uncharacterized protein YjbI with pentapeptide repeats
MTSDLDPDDKVTRLQRSRRSSRFHLSSEVRFAADTLGDLSGQVFENGTVFWRCPFKKARGISAPNARFIECDLSHGEFSEADLPAVQMQHSSLQDANLQGANLRYGQFAQADLSRAHLGASKHIQSGSHPRRLNAASLKGAQQHCLPKPIFKGATFRELC